jgi:RNA polymerase sigma factor (sigma-70 family)
MYFPLIHKLVNKYGWRESDREDLFQDCVIVGLKALNKYEWHAGKFITFLYNSIGRYLRSQTVYYQKWSQVERLLEDIPCKNDEFSLSPKFEFDLDILNKCDKLSTKEKRIISMRFTQDYTLDAIGEEVQLCKERVRQVLAKSLLKLRKVV